MIDARELRLGNLLDNCGQWCFVMSIYKNNKVELGYFKDSVGFVRSLDDLAIKPIPLTEQWLIDFGFVGNDQGLFDKYIGHLNFCQFTVYASKTGMVLRQPISIKIYHVHQLQNLYFALTGKELTKK